MAKSLNRAAWQDRIAGFWGLSLQIIGVVFIARFITDVGTRMLYPFIPQFSAGLGMTVTGFGWLLFMRSIVGVTGPIFGVLADRYGRRKVMANSLFFQAAGGVGLAFSQGWWAALPLIVSGLAVIAFVPAQQAYISDQASYQKRGRAMGVIEFSWASVAIVALPAVGWLIQNFGWRAPLLALSLFSLSGAVFMWRYLPPNTRRQTRVALTRQELATVAARKNVIAAVGTALLLFIAVVSFSTLWGLWLVEEFGLAAATVGLVGTSIGAAELLGAGMASLFIDRLGKRRGSGIALLLSAAGLLLLPFAQGALFAVVAALFVLSATFEFAIIALLPLYAEQYPPARATVLSLVFFGIAIGAAVGAPVTAMLWQRGGLWSVCALDAFLLLAAFLLMWKFLVEGE